MQEFQKFPFKNWEQLDLRILLTLILNLEKLDLRIFQILIQEFSDLI